MKNKIFIFILVFILHFIIKINSDNFNLNDLKKLVDKHSENTNKIMELEKKLVKYKFTSSNEILNIINRKNIEKNIQKRNQIIKKINNLTSENEILSNKLLNAYDLLYINLKSNYTNKIYRLIIDYIDDLKINNYKKIIFLDAAEIDRLYNENKIDLLRIKYNAQNIILTELKNFIKNLKIKSNLYKKMPTEDNYKKLSQKIDLLNKILADAELSQYNVSKYIK